MARLDAIALSHALKKRLVDFSVSHNFTRNDDLEAIARRIWSEDPERGGLCSEIWVESAAPPRLSSHTTANLANEGALSSWLTRHLAESKIFPSDRPLYEHQAESVYACRSNSEEKPAVILTAGTGAGKTESFLLPILSNLAETDRAPHSGCRALILYPMNALVNDQVDRLYSWLKGQSKLTLAHFTSETPENHGAAGSKYPLFEDCRHRTRRRARGLEDENGKKLKPHERRNPPDIMVTNYSMLEYMLCRPQDKVFFGPGLQAVVLDEAHLYTGTLAAEITLLLRRLYDKCGIRSDQVLQFATSATIGRGRPEELRDFASTLFSKPKEQVKVIQGRRSEPVYPEPARPSTSVAPEVFDTKHVQQRTIIQDSHGKEDLLVSGKSCDELSNLLNKLVDKKKVDEERRSCEDQPAKLLRVLRFCEELQELDIFLRKHKQIPLHTLARHVWGTDSRSAVTATSSLLGLASAARDDLKGIPLLPHRLHLMLRPADGLSVCLNPDCTGPPNRRYSGLGTVLASGTESCPYCEHHCLALFRCASCGQDCIAACDDSGYLSLPPVFQKPNTFLAISDEGGLTVDPSRGCYGSGPIRVKALSECANCEAELELMRPFETGGSLALSILSETLLVSLPPLPTQDERSNTILPARGRRLLAFSDSRSEASRLGPRLRKQHDLQIIRAAVVRLFEDQPTYSQEELEELEDEIEMYQKMLRESDKRKSSRQARLEELLNDKEALTAGGAVSDWSERLAEREGAVLAEILDDELGRRHEAADWNQNVWEQNAKAAKNKAEDFFGHLLARLPRRHVITLESIGAVEVTYPGIDAIKAPAESLGALKSERMRDILKEQWTNLLLTSCDLFRSAGCITLGNREKDLEWQQERVPIGQWMIKERFQGKTDRGLNRRFLRAVLSRIEPTLSQEELDNHAREVLGALFESLLQYASKKDQLVQDSSTFPWLQQSLRVSEEKSDDGLQLIFPRLTLRKPHELYICEKTGHVWPREVLGCAPETGSSGTLRRITEDELDQSGFVGRARREFKSDDITFKVGLWAEEHSAQLSIEETRRLQELFQRGQRNLLSATTTLELGIDIGGLSGTFLSNVPPSKANYLQRAGRVGRRADGSSVVVTCARSRPYDREVFHRIGDFLERPHRQPRVFLERERIARRHFHAWLMGRFFAQLYSPESEAGAMQAFGNMGQFCGVKLPDKWKKDDPRKPVLRPADPPLDGDLRKPTWWDDNHSDGLITQFKLWLQYAATQDFSTALSAIFVGTKFETQDPGPLFTEAEARFDSGLKDWLDDYNQLLKLWKQAREAREPRQANAICYQLRTLYRLTVIETFSNARFLPRYGFPIGVHRLRVVVPEENEKTGKVRMREEDQFRLERSSILALREYVPGSQLLVGGRLVTSRGLLKHWSGANIDSAFGLRGRAAKCKNGHNYYWYSNNLEACPNCREMPEGEVEPLLFPQHGFTTAGWDPPKRSVDVDRVGTVISSTTAFASKVKEHTGFIQRFENFGGVQNLLAIYREEGELMVSNRGADGTGFVICTACGYAESEPKKPGKALSRSFQRHKPLFGDKKSKACLEIFPTAQPMRKQTLCSREPTDIILIDPSHFLEPGRKATRSIAMSLAVALKIAGAKLLELDSRELGCMEVPAGLNGNSWGAVIYDTVPGGAGHSLELLQIGREWLEETRRLLIGTDEHNQLCQRACLDCILTFDAQALLNRGGVHLDRRLALDLLNRILDDAPQEQEELPPAVEGKPELDIPTLSPHDLTKGPELSDLLKSFVSDTFALQMPTRALENLVTPGSWCRFRRLSEDDMVAKNSIVLAYHPKLTDPEFGTVTLRRLSIQDFEDVDRKPTKRVLKFSPKSSDRERFKRETLELRGEELTTWHPLAIFEEVLN